MFEEYETSKERVELWLWFVTRRVDVERRFERECMGVRAWVDVLRADCRNAGSIGRLFSKVGILPGAGGDGSWCVCERCLGESLRLGATRKASSQLPYSWKAARHVITVLMFSTWSMMGSGEAAVGRRAVRIPFALACSSDVFLTTVLPMCIDTKY